MYTSFTRQKPSVPLTLYTCWSVSWPEHTCTYVYFMSNGFMYDLVKVGSTFRNKLITQRQGYCMLTYNFHENVWKFLLLHDTSHIISVTVTWEVVDSREFCHLFVYSFMFFWPLHYSHWYYYSYYYCYYSYYYSYYSYSYYYYSLLLLILYFLSIPINIEISHCFCLQLQDIQVSLLTPCRRLMPLTVKGHQLGHPVSKVL